MIKKIAFKLILLFLLCVVINFIYAKWFYENDIQKYSPIINLVRDIDTNTDVIYIGESSNITTGKDDVDKRPISDFIGDFYPGLNVRHITKPASHAGIYKILLENVPETNKAKTVVVTLNLRSFNSQWIYSTLETPLQKSMVLIKPYPPLVNRFLLSFKAYDIKSDEERAIECRKKWKQDEFKLPYEFEFKNVIDWDYWMAVNGVKDSSGNYDNEKSELACHFIKAYGFQLDTLNNPRINDFDAIVDLAKIRGWNLVFNLLAENVDKAIDLVGVELTQMMNKNSSILMEYYERKDVVVVNNLNSVEDVEFIDQIWTTEHYAEKGRKVIAKNVATALKKWYNEYFEMVE